VRIALRGQLLFAPLLGTRRILLIYDYADVDLGADATTWRAGTSRERNPVAVA